jgi:hypothetical protein
MTYHLIDSTTGQDIRQRELSQAAAQQCNAILREQHLAERWVDEVELDEVHTRQEDLDWQQEQGQETVS